MMRVLVTGAQGMLGVDLQESLSAHSDIAVHATDRADLDITDAGSVEDAVADCDVVINCAAWTAVDEAETQEDAAFAINSLGAANIARACSRTGAWVLQISTDYVFSGDARKPYEEDAPVGPRCAYGRTKAAGEWAVRAAAPHHHWILRTAWLYGEHGPNFVRTMVRLAKEQETVRVVNDQCGQPTWTRDLAGQIVKILRGWPEAGTYHATASGLATWHDLAQEVFRLIDADPRRVHPASSAEFRRPAPRPHWSVLGHSAWRKTGIEPIRDWHEALSDSFRVGAMFQA